MSNPTEDDQSHICATIQRNDREEIIQQLGTQGFQLRGADRIPGVKHKGQAFGLIWHCSLGRQVHAVFYPSVTGFGFDVAAHEEWDEVSATPAHLFEAKVLRKQANYDKGEMIFLEKLRASGLSYLPPPGRSELRADAVSRGR